MIGITMPRPDLKALLLRSRLTLAVAESVTCGQLQAQIGEISGASGFFVGGITAYTLEQKVKHLGVDRAAAEPVDCVSAPVAAEMAEGACRLFGADIAVATTGYAELPRDTGGGQISDPPYVFWALHDHPRAVTRTGRLDFPGASRIKVQTWAAAAVLKELEKYLSARNNR